MNSVIRKYMVEFMNIAQRCYNHKKTVYLISLLLLLTTFKYIKTS